MLEPISLIFKLNNGVVSRTLDGLSDDEVWQGPPGGGHPIGRITGPHAGEHHKRLRPLCPPRRLAHVVPPLVAPAAPAGGAPAAVRARLGAGRPRHLSVARRARGGLE